MSPVAKKTLKEALRAVILLVIFVVTAMLVSPPSSESPRTMAQATSATQAKCANLYIYSLCDQ